MKNPFDRIVGPEGEWRDPEARGGEADGRGNGDGDWGEREAFALRCLNAAVGLYGVVTMGEMAMLYNRYAEEIGIDVGGKVSASDMERIAGEIMAQIDDEDEPFDPHHANTYFFCLRNDRRTGERLVVCDRMLEFEDCADGTPRTPEEQAAKREELVDDQIAKLRDSSRRFDMRILPPAFFFDYAEPYFFEETDETRALARFVEDEYCVRVTEAAHDVEDIVGNMQEFGATVTQAVDFISQCLEWGPGDADGFERLIRAIGPVASVTRTWEYRGHNASELCKMGAVPRLEKEDVPDVFGVLDDDGDELDDSDDSDDYEDGEPIIIEELPPAKCTGPVDFKFVKDAEKREKALYDYEGVRIITKEFVRHVVIPESTKEERIDAAKRLGFPVDEKSGNVLDRNLDMVVGDFATMMDDQHGEPAVRRVLKRKDKLDSKYDRAAAEYYESYRYTWLEVLAVKSGVGLKCRDLMTGEDIFLMETSVSRGDVKGMTICAGIAPMGSLYLALGVIHPANFENPATILKIVLTHLGLPTEPPIRLSFSDQARLAAETIRRINANGKFGSMVYG